MIPLGFEEGWEERAALSLALAHLAPVIGS